MLISFEHNGLQYINYDLTDPHTLLCLAEEIGEDALKAIVLENSSMTAEELTEALDEARKIKHTREDIEEPDEAEGVKETGPTEASEEFAVEDE